MRYLSVWLGLLICTLAAPAAGQRGEVYCHVTAITSEQLSNGVMVTIEGDGELHWDMDWGRLLEEGEVEGEAGEHWINIWGITEKFRRLPIRIWVPSTRPNDSNSARL